jgi:hypothetical protein
LVERQKVAPHWTGNQSPSIRILLCPSTPWFPPRAQTYFSLKSGRIKSSQTWV